MSGWFDKFKAKYQDQYDNDLPFWYEGEEVDRIIKEVERLRADITQQNVTDVEMLEVKIRKLEAENAAMREKLAESDKIIHRLRGVEK